MRSSILPSATRNRTELHASILFPAGRAKRILRIASWALVALFAPLVACAPGAEEETAASVDDATSGGSAHKGERCGITAFARCNADEALVCEDGTCIAKACSESSECSDVGIERCGANGTCLPANTPYVQVDPAKCNASTELPPARPGDKAHRPQAYIYGIPQGGLLSDCIQSLPKHTRGTICATPAFWCNAVYAGPAGTVCSCPYDVGYWQNGQLK